MKRKTPYQREPLYRRVILWWRHMPLAYVVACFHVARWCVNGCPRVDIGSHEIGPWVLSRRETGAMIWNSIVRVADMRMGNYYTMAEVFEDLRATPSSSASPDA